MAETELTLTPAQFEELRAQCDAIKHARDLGVLEGELKNTVVESEWTENEIGITITTE